MRSNNCRLFNFPPKKFDTTSDGVFWNALLHCFDVSRSPACTSTWAQDGGSSQPTQKNVDQCQKNSLTASKKSVEVRLKSLKLSILRLSEASMQDHSRLLVAHLLEPWCVGIRKSTSPSLFVLLLLHSSFYFAMLLKSRNPSCNVNISALLEQTRKRYRERIDLRNKSNLVLTKFLFCSISCCVGVSITPICSCLNVNKMETRSWK